MLEEWGNRYNHDGFVGKDDEDKEVLEAHIEALFADLK